MPKTKGPLHLENLGSLITFRQDGKDCCLGDLICHEDSVFDPTYDKVDVTPEQAEIHNKCYSKALIDGLDKCEIGQCGGFYYSYTDGKYRVSAWHGTLVAEARLSDTNELCFTRKGRGFAGRMRRGSQHVTFKRVS